MYLAPDEAIIANDAYAIATTGRTLDGVFLPLYVYVSISASWFMPYIYYWTAIWLQLLPLAEWSIRVPTAIIGLAGLILAYRVARRLLGDRALALIATAMLGCAPTYFILSRYALDYIYPVPFILGWLYCLTTGLDSGRSRRWLVAAGLCLGAGFYSYIASVALMPSLLRADARRPVCREAAGARSCRGRCRLRDSADRLRDLAPAASRRCFGPRPSVTGLPARPSAARPSTSPRSRIATGDSSILTSCSSPAIRTCRSRRAPPASFHSPVRC